MLYDCYDDIEVLCRTDLSVKALTTSALPENRIQQKIWKLVENKLYIVCSVELLALSLFPPLTIHEIFIRNWPYIDTFC